MNTLNRHLLKNNLFLLLSLLLAGAGIFIIVDLFGRLDTFVDAGYGALYIILYFALRLPMILAQIMPMVFLLALVIQLALMRKHREITALQAGGISSLALFRFVCIYGLVCACVQFACAQVAGVAGERTASNMWNEEIRGRVINNTTISGLLFTQGRFVVRVETAWPYQEKARNILVYELSDDGLQIISTHTATEADSSRRGWTLREVDSLIPQEFIHRRSPSLNLDIRQDLGSFKTFQPRSRVEDMPLDELFRLIQRLEQSGTNVKAMRSEYHNRFAYAGSVLSLGILALAISMLTENIYLAVLIALLCNFTFYAGTNFFATLSAIGALPPATAAWGANGIAAALALLYIFSHYLYRIKPVK